eukprot:CAMPEP_0174954150 /NCGR_PEP_ID=MMETSP0004_2-20121128/265_1 /TAXON_ID=420556 /ORGANISM="Ochromonas sp., Strain CCMP1393" /LENGTH=988 /DNA_ID=CAMNT_0016201933 /DNA_START=1859 /DNA_END=4825 /DNA_ORIENTATION=-
MSKGLAKLFDWARPHKKRVYYLNEGSIEEKSVLGNKGANLCEMYRLGMPVPPAFVITAESCLEYFKQDDEELDKDLVAEYTKGVHEIESQTGKQFGGNFKTQHPLKPPLLLSVRSGAAVSMPGMMDTILNLGINDDIVDVLARISNNPRWAFDTYRRFLQMFGNVVLGVDKQLYEDVLQVAREKRGVPHDSLLTMADLVDVVKEFKKIATVPAEPWEQLNMAVQAVFKSWYSPRAVKYRDIHHMHEVLGTAVNIQSMVYGNMNTRSGSGVAFTRNPTTGEKEMYGEFLSNAEGEDVVSGVRTPMKLTELRTHQPQVYDSLRVIEGKLERHYRDMQDLEFTVENGTLFILQTRTGKRTARAAVHIAAAMVRERLITEREALLRINPSQMDFFLHPMIDPEFANEDDPKVAERILGKGLAASAGAATGKVVFSCEEAEACQRRGEDCILVRFETSADDIGGLQAAKGVLTLRGGLTSHAAVVMRGMGKPAVVGVQQLYIDTDTGVLATRPVKAAVATASSTSSTPAAATATAAAVKANEAIEAVQAGIAHAHEHLPQIMVKQGETITIDGSTGIVYTGEMPTVSVGQDENFLAVMQWADKYKRLHVLANAESPEDVQQADRMGAEGVGLCRTEHMFFHEARIDLFRHLILTDNPVERQHCLAQLLPLQQADFLQIFTTMGPRQVTIRLLDPPLHEFLPRPQNPDFSEEIAQLAARGGIPPAQCERRVRTLQENNPMLGFRGCRLSIVYPEITEMQVKAIVGAVIEARDKGIDVHAEIMIPLVVTDHEVDLIAPIVTAAAESVCAAASPRHTLESLNIRLGSMIETPRACIRADRIAAARNISFLSVGSNDLTQFMFGFSRDDTQRFMADYLDKHLIAKDPFTSIDLGGVGGMIQMTVRRAQRANKDIQVGVCGEHAGDPASVQFFDKIGVDYISCSPYRIPIAKVAAAQSHIEEAANRARRELEHQHVNPMSLFTNPYILPPLSLRPFGV